MGMGGILAPVLVAATGINQMRQIELIHPFVAAKIQHGRQVMGIALGYGKA
ncbi:hypothetical protein D9M69_693700 [compost metagenome]